MNRNRGAQLDRVLTLHRVILAGLGALAKTRSEGGDELFRELVEKGEELEALGGRWSACFRSLPRNLPSPRRGGSSLYPGVLERLVQQRRTSERMIDAMLPETPLPTPPAVLQAVAMRRRGRN